MVSSVSPDFIRLNGFSPEPVAIKLLPAEIARRYAIAPLWLEGDELVIACAGSAARRARREISARLRRPVRALLASLPEIRAVQARAYGAPAERPPVPEMTETLVALGNLRAEDRAAAPQTVGSGSPGLQGWLSSGLVGENGLAEAVAWQNALPHLRRESLKPQVGLAALISWEVAEEKKAVPLLWFQGALVLATPEPEERLDLFFSKQLGVPVWLVVVPVKAWQRLFRQLYLRGVPDGTIPRGVQVLVEKGVLSAADLKGAQAVSQQTGRPLERILLDRGLVSSSQWLEAQARASNIPTTPLSRKRELAFQPEPEALSLLPPALAKAHSLLPLQRDSKKLVLGIATPDAQAVRLVENLTGLKVEPRLVDRKVLLEKIERAYSDSCPLRPKKGADLGGLLLAMGVITGDQLAEARQLEASGERDLGESLVHLGYLNETDVSEALGLLSGIPFAGLEHAVFDLELIRRIPVELAREHMLAPFYACGQDLWVAVADPFDGPGLLEVEAATGMRAWPLLVPRSILGAAIERAFGRGYYPAADPDVQALLDHLVQRNLLTNAQSLEALQRASTGALTLDRAIREATGFSEQKLVETFAALLGLPVVNLDLQSELVAAIDPLGQKVTRQVTREPVQERAARLIDLETARRLSALPIRRTAASVSVAFASPPLESAIRELEADLGLHVRPCLATRSTLDGAIQRLLGRKNIGTYLLLAGLINRSQLNDALELARRTGVRLGRALVDRGYITQEQLYRFLAEQAHLPFYDLNETKIERATARLIDPDTARAYGILPVAADDQRVTLATVDPLNQEALETAARLTGRAISPVLVTERGLETALERIYSREYLAESVSSLLDRSPGDSAFRVLNLWQWVSLAIFLVLTVLWVIVDYRSYIIVLNALATIFYLSFSAYKFYLVYRSMSHDLEVPVTKAEIEALRERDLPVYTILIPIYKEAQVLPELLEAVANLDYPTTKLDIKVLMEQDDSETLAAFNELSPPVYFEPVIVPAGQPKTKPKACNYGLIHARGEYVVIFDAEDLPDRDQLKRVLVAFSKVSPEVVCLQSKLNYYNRDQNLLTRWFTVEYSMWFDLFLPGLDASRAPIPLGGTSNHFKRDALIDGGAWDPYNVTEDADLGIRMHKRGYRTAIVDTTTYEEANSQVYNWIRQRSRWIKGYIQTWLVHMRNPAKLIDEIGFKSFLSFQFVIGGTVFAALLNPIYWVLTTLWFLLEWDFVRQIFPGPIFYFGAICLYLGNFAFTFVNVAGAMRRGYYDMVKYALLSPLYWGLMSVGAWRGFFQLLTRPHFWEKTVHGLYEGPLETE